MPVVPFVYIEPPTVTPYRHGLFDVAREIKTDRPNWQYGGVEWESLASYLSVTYPGGLNDVNGSGGAKVLPACAGVTQASAFGVFGGVAAGSLGHTEQEWVDRSRAILELSAQHAVESALWTGSGGGGPALNAAGTAKILTGQPNTVGGAVDMVTGLALAEKWLTDTYAGRGQIHAPRWTAPYLAQLQQVRQDRTDPELIVTVLDTKLAFGGGYDGTGPAAVAPPGATYTGGLNAPTGLAGSANVGGGSFAAATYFWKVTALDSSGETVGSNEVTNAVALNGTETLTWNAVPGATSYRVYRSTATNAELLIASAGNALTYTDTGITGTTPIPTTNTTGTLAIAEQQFTWIYATGETFRMSGEIFEPRFGEALDRSGNQVRLYAEQSWIVGVDGRPGAILVKTPSIT
jgi:hypothetical protein